MLLEMVLLQYQIRLRWLTLEYIHVISESQERWALSHKARFWKQRYGATTEQMDNMISLQKTNTQMYNKCYLG
jgi:hypothetical protein